MRILLHGTSNHGNLRPQLMQETFRHHVTSHDPACSFSVLRSFNPKYKCESKRTRWSSSPGISFFSNSCLTGSTSARCTFYCCGWCLFFNGIHRILKRSNLCKCLTIAQKRSPRKKMCKVTFVISPLPATSKTRLSAMLRVPSWSVYLVWHRQAKVTEPKTPPVLNVNVICLVPDICGKRLVGWFLSLSQGTKETWNFIMTCMFVFVGSRWDKMYRTHKLLSFHSEQLPLMWAQSLLSLHSTNLERRLSIFPAILLHVHCE